MKSFGKLSVATASLSLLFEASLGWAQTDPAPAGGGAAESGQSDALQEIVVTAQKRTESMQAVPIAITAISSEQLRGRRRDQHHGAANGVTGLESRHDRR